VCDLVTVVVGSEGWMPRELMTHAEKGVEFEEGVVVVLVGWKEIQWDVSHFNPTLIYLRILSHHVPITHWLRTQFL